MNIQPPFGKTNPFPATLLEKTWLSQGNSQRKTFHLVLDLRGSGYTYNVGDSIAIVSVNDSNVVEKTLKSMKASGSEIVFDRKGESFNLREFLTTKANITEISRKFFTDVQQLQSDPVKKEHLQWLLQDENRDGLKSYLECRQVWDFLSENSEVTFSPQEVVALLKPLLPRFYSIASSQKAVNDQVHLTVANLKYKSNGHERFGVCTHYLCDMTPLNQALIPIYIHPSNGFTLPEDINTDIVMVGPGTGVAPFRGFMQERIASRASGKNWLFFGEWRSNEDYYYYDFWKDCEAKGVLRIDTAFSRDQEDKIYVQHRMLEHGRDLFAWLENGAVFYVCGDAHRMAKDVDAALHHIVQIHGEKSESEAKNYIKRLRAEKKYLRDVY